ncbi:MAG: hypothetical protein WCK35_06890 [Chloroflexota bacterium]
MQVKRDFIKLSGKPANSSANKYPKTDESDFHQSWDICADDPIFRYAGNMAVTVVRPKNIFDQFTAWLIDEFTV